MTSAPAAPAPSFGRTSRRRTFNLSRLVRALSVRTRILLIALIPVLGFAANGISFTAGEREVAEAFDRYRRADATADASHSLKEAISKMRIAARDFATDPDEATLGHLRLRLDLAVHTLSHRPWHSLPRRFGADRRRVEARRSGCGTTWLSRERGEEKAVRGVRPGYLPARSYLPARTREATLMYLRPASCA